MLNKFTIQKSFAINAGAGSGKTYTLSRRYINAILEFPNLAKNVELPKEETINLNKIFNKQTGIK